MPSRRNSSVDDSGDDSDDDQIERKIEGRVIVYCSDERIAQWTIRWATSITRNQVVGYKLWPPEEIARWATYKAIRFVDMTKSQEMIVGNDLESG